MSDLTDAKRRRFLQRAGIGAAGLAAARLGLIEAAQAQTIPAPRQPAGSSGATTMGPIRQVHADVLDIGYHEAGPSDGRVVLLLHGYPYDIHSYVEVAPMLAAQGVRVIVPYLRGHGSTRFLDAATPRAGQQGAIGADVIALMDALRIPGAVLAGFDWGGRAACVAAALWPERCKGLVSVNSYLIQDIARAMTPIPAKIELGLWYQYYFGGEIPRAADPPPGSGRRSQPAAGGAGGIRGRGDGADESGLIVRRRFTEGSDRKVRRH